MKPAPTTDTMPSTRTPTESFIESKYRAGYRISFPDDRIVRAELAIDWRIGPGDGRARTTARIDFDRVTEKVISEVELDEAGNVLRDGEIFRRDS